MKTNIPILKEIAEQVSKNITLDQKEQPLSKDMFDDLSKNDFVETFKSEGLNIISEIKFASPSEGEIFPRSAENAVKIAEGYISNGAKALSVLTERSFFKGDYKYVQSIKEKFPNYKVLMKDFIIDEYQLYKAKQIGADAILLIVALLDKATLFDLYNKAQELGLSVLTEVHNLEEFNIAIELDAELIGINNRNLKTMKVSLDTSFEIAKEFHKYPNKLFISESGIKTKNDLEKLSAVGYSGFLIGTSFMKTSNPSQALKDMLQ